MASNRSKRPRNPEYLVRAVHRIFGKACLQCGTERPTAVMAHIRNWSTTRQDTAADFPAPLSAAFLKTLRAKLKEPPTGAQPDLDRLIYEDSYSRFHDLGNVLPLCPNCHALLDGPQYDELVEGDVLALRDDAVRGPEVLARAIDFVRAELRGRPNRCTCALDTDDNRQRKHSFRADLMALGAPLAWIANGVARSLDLGETALVVDSASRRQHYHVALDAGTVGLCLGAAANCPQKFRTPAAPAAVR
ncbi:HNH endonuclease [Streptomyces sp. NPDC053253]|uniref:HNH endonuclease n=1 Tax=Streptomyces sp. NPDC053253 TaxID=3365699 RepID=UPI0037D79865